MPKKAAESFCMTQVDNVIFAVQVLQDQEHDLFRYGKSDSSSL